MIWNEEALRVVRQRTGPSYDAFAYNPAPSPLLDPRRLLGQAALFGLTQGRERPIDVLDLACGAGAELARTAEIVGGRLVGVDVSKGQVALARARCASFGDRVEVRCADLYDVTADELGRYDLVHLVGVAYLVPAPVREHMISLACDCLRPGGVLVISYYAGLFAALRSYMYRMLRTVDDPSRPVDERIARARELVVRLRARVPAHAPVVDMGRTLLDWTRDTPGELLFHEGLEGGLEPLDTLALATSMASRGVEFLDYVDKSTVGAVPPPAERALSAQAFDLGGGGYRRALFGRREAGAAFDVRTPAVAWRTAEGEPADLLVAASSDEEVLQAWQRRAILPYWRGAL